MCVVSLALLDVDGLSYLGGIGLWFGCNEFIRPRDSFVSSNKGLCAGYWVHFSMQEAREVGITVTCKRKTTTIF